MTRDELIETMALAMDAAVWAESMPVPTRAYVLGYHSSRQESAAIARSVLAAIETAGLAIVPVEANDRQIRSAFACGDSDPHYVYGAMIEAGNL